MFRRRRQFASQVQFIIKHAIDKLIRSMCLVWVHLIGLHLVRQTCCLQNYLKTRLVQEESDRIAFGFRVVALCLLVIPHNGAEEEEDQEEEEDKLTSSSSSFSFLEVIRFNDTIEGPRAPAVKPGRVTQA